MSLIVIDDDVDDSAYFHDWSTPTARKRKSTWWTAEGREDLFRKLWLASLDAHEIARRMQITTNAVYGKRRRLGLPIRGQELAVRRPRQRKPRPA